jgi:hypothetical protein
MINIPAHNPQTSYVLYEKQYSAGEQTENHDFVKPILSDSLPPARNPTWTHPESDHDPSHFSVGQVQIFFLNIWIEMAKPSRPALIKVINVRIQISRKPSVIVDVATESGCEHYDLVLFAKIGNFVTFRLCAL